MRIAFDTNVLVYAEGVTDVERRIRARFLLDALGTHELVLPVQVAGELYRVMTGKMKRSRDEARAALADWQAFFETHPPTTSETLTAALDLAERHSFQIWDALIVSAAREARCHLLLSEDMAHGFAWRGLTIVNPFQSDAHPLLADALL